MDDMPRAFPPPPEGDLPPGRVPQPKGHFPLDINSVLELTFSLFRFNWRTFLVTSLVTMIPVASLMAVSSLVTSPAESDWLSPFIKAARGQPFSLESISVSALAVSLLMSLLVSIAIQIAEAAVTYAAARSYIGGEVDALAAVRFSLSRFVTLTVAVVLIFLMIFGIVFLSTSAVSLLSVATSPERLITAGPGAFLSLVVAVAAVAALVFTSIRWALVVPVLVLEGGSAARALGRSWRLVSGSSLRVLGYLVVFGLTVGLISFVFTFALMLVLEPAILTTGSTDNIDPARLALLNFASGMFSALLIPFSIIGVTLLYLDLRWRRGEAVPQPGQTAPTPP